MRVDFVVWKDELFEGRLEGGQGKPVAGPVGTASNPRRVPITPAEVFQLLKDGNERFRTGQRIRRDYVRQMSATAPAQFPIAAVLSCIDSRAPVELLFDQGLGDLFCVRIAGNVAKNKVIGSLEYSCVVAGAILHRRLKQL